MNKIKASLILVDIINYIDSEEGIFVKKALKGDFSVSSLHEADRRLVLGVIDVYELLK